MTASFATGFDHIHLRSPDPDAAAQFYVDRFGAEVTDRLTPNVGGYRVIVALAGHRLFIEKVAADTRPAAEPPHRGLEHLGLLVSDLDAAAAELKRHGVRFTLEPETRSPTLRIAFIRGPDDVSIELLQRSAAG